VENRFDAMPYLLVFIRRRKILLLHLVFIVCAAWTYVFFFTKKEFKSEIVFLPPSSETSFGGVLQGFSLPSVSSSDIMPEQIETIFSSKSLKRRIIDKFNLYNHYKMNNDKNKFENTLNLFKKSLLLTSEEKGGIGFSKAVSFSLGAYYTSPDTAFLIANFAFDLLDSAVRAISVDRAHRNRVFIENQFEKNKLVLDSLQKEMKDFQLKNKAYNIPEQVAMSINAYANIKSSIIANEIRIQAIKNEFSGETPELLSLEKGNEAYKNNLAQLETRQSPDAMLSLSNATKLFPQYTNLLRDIEVQNQILLLMTRELEQSKIKEEKNISSLIVTDPAFVPEYKARPKRIVNMAIMIGIYMAFIFLFTFLMEVYRIQLKDSDYIRAIKDSFRKK
jgi:uncharacterized protein involved in exopolysaccharide biosynthesis